MFEESLLRSRPQPRWTLAASLSAQTAAVGVMILVPLLATEALPLHSINQPMMAPPRPAPKPLAVQVQTSLRRSVPVRALTGLVWTKASRIPEKVDLTPEEILPGSSDPQEIGVPGSIGTPSSVGSGVGQIAQAPPPPVVKPKPEPAPTPQTGPVRVSSGVQAARCVSCPRPAYPSLARQMRIEGTVRMNAVIDRDGRISNLQLVMGHPLLQQAALDAVKRWVYQPTVLNAEPVQVATTIDVVFKLSQ